MASKSKECIDHAISELKNFDREDLEQYVKDVLTRTKELDPDMNAKAVDSATKEINEQALKSYFQDITQKAKNIVAFEKNSSLLKEKSITMRSLISTRGKFLARNLASSQKADYQTYFDFVFSSFSHEEVELISSGKIDQDILDIHSGAKLDNPIAKRFADRINDWFTYRNAESILSGALKFEEINGDRYFRAIHDPLRIMTGNKSLTKMASDKLSKKVSLEENRTLWKNTIKKFIDIDKTFSKTDAADFNGVVDMEKADKMLDRIYNNITSGKSNIFTRSVVANDREAMQKRSRMFFVFKSLNDQYQYNKAFGEGNLFGMMMRDIRSTSSRTGVAKIWGDNPYTMYNDLRNTQESIKPMGGLWWHTTDNYFKVAMGLDKSTTSPTVSNFTANIRTLSSMARLALVTVNSISDIGYQASFAQRMGISYFKAWTNQLSHVFNRFPTEERSRIAKLFSTMVDSHLGYMGRWVENNNVSSILNKISTKFFKFNLLDSFDKGGKVGILHLMSKHLFENSSKSYEKLEPQLKRWVGKFLSDKEWDLLRKKNKDRLFTTDNVESLTQEEIRQFWNESDKSLALSEVRDDLHRKVYTMFSVASENAVLSPAEFEKAFIYHGTNPGTPVGEALRIFGQFKMYTLAFIDRVLVQGFKEADTASQKILWATSLLAGTLPLSMMSMFFNNLSQGLSMPDWEEMNVSERIQFLVELLSPSASLAAGLLFSDRNKGSQFLTSMLGSPSSTLIGNSLSAPLALLSGNPDKAAKHLSKASSYLIPWNTTPIMAPLIRQALGQEAYLQPGQTHYFGQ